MSNNFVRYSSLVQNIMLCLCLILQACSQHSSRQGKPMTPYSSFCRRTLGKIWSTNILFQQRTKGKSSRSTTQFLFRRIPFFK
uniref:Secreted protein n=1 Tax=Aegilops tauschii subsp. strangulata TaxID=200361 RepID=A0A453PMM3_AEGTS